MKSLSYNFSLIDAREITYFHDVSKTFAIFIIISLKFMSNEFCGAIRSNNDTETYVNYDDK